MWHANKSRLIDTDTHALFSALDTAAEGIDVCLEGCYGPRDGRPGRAYLAVPSDVTIDAVMSHLTTQQLPVTLTLVHPRDDEE